jgi:GT2 family glycosyltransferase
LTSIVVVAADSGALLVECVADVLASSTPVELIISDNASTDGSIEKICARWPDEARLRLVRNGSNLGFGAGCNRGAAIGTGDVLLFLNPDCRLAADSISRLRSYVNSSTGVIGARIVGTDSKPEPASRRRDPLLRRALMTATGLARFETHWPSLAGTNLPARDDPPDYEEVDAVSGALMLVPRQTYARLGGFDEGYFLHFEDFDLCRRARDLGLRVACANCVRVTHAKGTSSRSRPFSVARHKHRGMLRWFGKFDPTMRNPLLRALVQCAVWAHYALLAPFYAWVWLCSRFSGSD